MENKKYIAELYENELRVAEVDCPTFKEAEREIQYYYMMYSQDLQKRVKLVIKRKYNFKGGKN